MPVPIAIAATRIGMQLLSTPKGRVIVASAVTAIVTTVAAPLLLGAAMIAGLVGQANTSGTSNQVGSCLSDAPTPDPSASSDAPDLSKFDAEQTNNAKIILGIIKSAALPTAVDTQPNRQRAGVIALSTALQESSLHNLNGGDADSVGLFQQRPSAGWGTVTQLTTPQYAAAAFILGVQTAHIRGLIDFADWPSMPVTIAAQAVQVSAYPDAYAKWEADATAMVSAWWNDAPAQPVPAELVRTDFTSAGTGTVTGAGDSGCNSSFTPGTGTVTLGAWGDPPYQNGEIPLSALCIIPWAPAYYLRCDATQALIALNEKWKADHSGTNLVIDDAYRTYDRQVQLKASEGFLASEPGTSNHGWALAVDLGGFGQVGDFTSANYAWMKSNGPAFGFTHPPHMEPGGSGPLEPWHFEYTGVPETATAGTAS